MSYVTHLHKISLMSRFLHVEFNITLSRVQSVLQIGENQASVLFFCPMLHQILKLMIMRKGPLKKKNLISISFKRTFKIAKNT